MGRIAEQNLKLAAEAFYSKDDKLIEKVIEEEKRVNLLEKEISEYFSGINEWVNSSSLKIPIWPSLL